MRNLPSILPLRPSPGLFPQRKVTGAVVRPGLHPARVEVPRDSRVSPVSCGAPDPECGCPGTVPLLKDVLDSIPVPGSCLCPRACPREPGCSPLPGSPQCSLPGCPGSPEPRELLCAGSQLPAPRSARGNILSRLRELSTPQIARPAWPPAGVLRRWPADDLTAWEAPNMLLLPIKSKGLWAWNHREHGDCASQGRRSREAALLGRRKDSGS